MPTNSEGAELQKHTLNLYRGDYARLGDLFPQSDPAVVIRKMVRDLIVRVEGKKPNVEVDI